MNSRPRVDGSACPQPGAPFELLEFNGTNRCRAGPAKPRYCGSLRSPQAMPTAANLSFSLI
jgi:hypothetical protein